MTIKCRQNAQQFINSRNEHKGRGFDFWDKLSKLFPHLQKCMNTFKVFLKRVLFQVWKKLEHLFQNISYHSK